MVLVDTSIWGHHLRAREPHLVELLLAGDVLVHPAVVGELALGNLRQRGETLALLRQLPRARIATDDEILVLVANLAQHARGIGWVDAHLIGAALLTGCELWSGDRALCAAALHARVRLHEN
jgi:hypothetical protein